ncbi:WD repeat-containing protein 47-like [Limulus polyphemus]|uniref:WD repeat-containing protein 47-like n=1 Tax=Limulus polyphemus TaxID=6850 RepID=A0ABM1SLG3_LIMPO|nr:WD repeat-containing protein 47-like [Limulus polyphemus]
MPSAHLTLKEEEVIRLVLEFLANRELNISQLSLEREAGVINGIFSDDVLFLRQLILDGQWDDVLKFIQPLETLETFDSKQFRYIVMKHKYIELLCIRSEIGPFQNIDVAVEEVVKCLNELEKYCPSKEDYNNFCLLLTFPRLSDHLDYKNWNPSNARVNCFKAVFPLVEKFLPLDKKGNQPEKIATSDRLIQLIIKGIIYESCVEFCQQRATAASSDAHEIHFSHVLNGTGFNDSDLSLLSWLQYIPLETFSYPFEQKTLNVEVEQLEKPGLEASWSEQILITPIKPKVFPHSAIPFTRLRTSDIMSRSLTPNLDAVGLGKNGMAFSLNDMSAMSKSFAGFHLTGKKAVNTSVDRLFEGGDVFSASVNDLHTILESSPSKDHSLILSLDKRYSSNTSKEKDIKYEVNSQNIKGKQNEQRSTNDNSEESFAVSLFHVNNADSNKSPTSEEKGKTKYNQSDSSSEHNSSDLWKEFQRQKQQFLDQLETQEKQRIELLQEINAGNVSEESHTVGSSPEIAENRNQSHLEGNFVTPVNVSGQNKNSHVEKLTTSTPKAQGTWSNTTPLPQSSPVLPKQNTSSKTSPSTSGWINVPNCVAKNLGPILDSQNTAGASSIITADPQYSSILVGHSGDDQHVECMVPVTKPVAQHYDSQPYFTPVNSKGNLRHPNELVGDGPAKKVSYQYDLTDVYFNSYNFFILTLPQVIPQQSMKTNGSALDWKKSKFLAVTKLEDAQAIRTGDFHPDGQLYAIGSNSKTLRICAYPKLHDLQENHVVHQPTVLLKRMKHHKGSIYCLAWNITGDLLATGSNDKTVKLMRFNTDTCNLEGGEAELTMHDGTVRDLCFVEDVSNRSTLMISGGAGDCKIYATDCETATPFQALSGHTGHIFSLYTWGGAMFVSGSQDKTIRFWDLRTQGCVNIVVAPAASGSGTVFQECTAQLNLKKLINISMDDPNVKCKFIEMVREEQFGGKQLLIVGSCGFHTLPTRPVVVWDNVTLYSEAVTIKNVSHPHNVYFDFLAKASKDHLMRARWQFFLEISMKFTPFLACYYSDEPPLSYTAARPAKGSPAAAVCVDPSGRLLVSGHEDANCMLYDIRGGRIVQCFQPHTSDVRTIRFSPKAFYLLTASYDHRIVLTDLQGDLTQPLPSVVVAEHADKVIQGRWHPQEFSFLTASADKTATLWALPTH